VIRKPFQIIFALLAVILLSGCGINNIPTFDEAVNGRWSEVQNQYKRRADLIPNLVSTVEGFAAQEKDVLLELTEARTRVSQMNISPEMLTDPAAFEAFQQNQGAIPKTESVWRVEITSRQFSGTTLNFALFQVVGGHGLCTLIWSKKRTFQLARQMLLIRP